MTSNEPSAGGSVAKLAPLAGKGALALWRVLHVCAGFSMFWWLRHDSAARTPTTLALAAILAGATTGRSVAEPVCGVPAEVTEWARTAGPGDLVPVVGSGLDCPDLRFSITASNSAGRRHSAEARVEAVQGDAFAVFRLPRELPLGATYDVTPVTGGRVAAPFAVNRPEVWWVGAAVTPADGSFSVFGRNLTGRDGHPRVRVALRGAAEATEEVLPALDANPYRLIVPMPRNGVMAARALMIRDLTSGSALTDKGVVLEMAGGTTSEDLPAVDVTSFGADPSGSVDSTRSILLADRVARSIGGEARFPPGRYVLTTPVDLQSGSRWRGVGRDAVTLMLHQDVTVLGATVNGKRYALGTREQDPRNMALDGLTLVAEPASSLDTTFLFRRVTGLRLADLRVLAGSREFGDLTDGYGIRITGNEIVGGSLTLGSAVQVRVADNLFRMTSGTGAALIVAGGHSIAVTGNRFEDADPDHTGDGRLFTTQGYAGNVSRIYFADNRSVSVGPGPDNPNQNSGEQVLVEMSSPSLGARVAAAGPDDLTAGGEALGRPPAGRPGSVNVTLVGGRGVGQTRRVVGIEPGAGRYRVEPSWRVQPDWTSRFVVSAVVSQMAIYRNDFGGKADWRRRETASAGVQCYGDCHQVAIEANTIHEVRHGVSLWAQAPSGTLTTTSYFTSVIGNRFLNTIAAVELFSDNLPLRPMPGSVGLMGTVVRGNFIGSGVGTAFYLQGCSRAAGFSQVMNVFEDNVVTDVRRVFDLNNHSLVRGRGAQPGPRMLSVVRSETRSGVGDDLGIVKKVGACDVRSIP